MSAVTSMQQFRSLFASSKVSKLAPISEDQQIEFGVFGKWSGETIRLVHSSCIDIVRRMLIKMSDQMSWEAKWEHLEEKHRDLFVQYRAATLFETSLNLPNATVMFEVLPFSGSLPENPPPAVHQRVIQAYLTHRDARLYILKPLFQDNGGIDVLSTTATMQDAQRIQRQSIQQSVAGWPGRLLRIQIALENLEAAIAEQLHQELTHKNATLMERLYTRGERLGRRIGILPIPRDPIVVFAHDNEGQMLRFAAHWDVIDGKQCCRI